MPVFISVTLYVITYKSKKRQVKNSINRAKSTYFKEKFRNCGNSTSKKWKTVKELIPDKKSQSNSHNHDSIPEKADEFNEFFSSVGQVTFEKTQENLDRIMNVNVDSINEFPGVEKFRPQPVAVDTVILTFKQLKETNAVGCDDISFKFLKDSFLWFCVGSVLCSSCSHFITKMSALSAPSPCTHTPLYSLGP